MVVQSLLAAGHCKFHLTADGLVEGDEEIVGSRCYGATVPAGVPECFGVTVATCCYTAFFGISPLGFKLAGVGEEVVALDVYASGIVLCLSLGEGVLEIFYNLHSAKDVVGRILGLFDEHYGTVIVVGPPAAGTLCESIGNAEVFIGVA